MYLSHLIYFIKPSDLKGSASLQRFDGLGLIHFCFLKLWEACSLVVKSCYPTRRKDPGWANDDWAWPQGCPGERDTGLASTLHMRLWNLDCWTFKWLILPLSSCIAFSKLVKLLKFWFSYFQNGDDVDGDKTFYHMAITTVNEVIHKKLLYYMESYKHNKY